MKDKKYRVVPIVCFLALIGFMTFVSIRSCKFDEELKENGKITIGQYVSYTLYPKTNSNFFVYYINGIKHRDDGGRVPPEFIKNIGKFYKIIYSEKHIGIIRPQLNEEITDTIAILNAGFSTEDIKRTQKY